MRDQEIKSAFLWDAKTTAKSLSISLRSLWSMTRPRGDLPAVRLGKRVLYDPRDLERMIDARKEGGKV